MNNFEMRLFEIDFDLRSVQNTLDYRIRVSRQDKFKRVLKTIRRRRHYIENNKNKLKQISNQGNIQINANTCSKSSISSGKFYPRKWF